MNKLPIFSALLFSFSLTLFSQEPTSTPSPTATNRNQSNTSIFDMQKDIGASDAKKLLIAVFDEKSKYSFVGTDRFVFARQILGSPNYTAAALGGGKFPLWELRIDTGFETQYLLKDADSFVWKFNVYHHSFPSDAILKLKIDTEELTFKATRSGQSSTSDYYLRSQSSPMLDTVGSNRVRNAGDNSIDANPKYFYFVLTRAQMKKIEDSKTTRISLREYLTADAYKDMRRAIHTMLDVTTVK